MQINTYAAMKQYLDAGGGYLQLDKQGKLVTQSAVGHFFQRIKDAFRSLSSSGRAAIAARNAALSAAMDELVRKDTLLNPVRMEIPRETSQKTSATLGTTQASAPRTHTANTVSARQSGGAVSTAGTSTGATPRSLEAFRQDVRNVAEEVVNRTWPQLDAESRADLLAGVLNALKDLPELVQQLGGDAVFLRENVEECVRTFASNAAPASTPTSAPSVSTVSVTQSSVSAHQTAGELQDVKWSNHTQEHPRGVCEAATSLWLNRIARGGQHGLSHANQLQPTDCDALQAQVEAGSGWTYSLNLRELLPANVTLHGSGDGFFAGIDRAMPNTIKGGQTNSTPSALLGTLQSGDFFYINASGFSGGNAGGHAMAVFYDGQQYHFFNPDTGIFHGTREQIAGYIESGVVNWSNVSVHQGHIPQA